MREVENPAKPSPASLTPIAVIAVGVLVLALVVSGSRTGTIVVQRITMSFITTTHGRTSHPRSLSITTINETSADGVEQRSLTSSSFTRPGFEQVIAGNTIEVYDPVDNTVYATTERGEQRALAAQVRSTAPKGSHVVVGVGKMQLVSASANSIAYFPGRTSVYAQWLRSGEYRLVGHQTVDGRTALELVQASHTKLPINSGSGGFYSRTTVYVAPGSYDPIETVNRSVLPGIHTTSIERWQSYRVLKATPAAERLLSLIARHPGARVVHNATAFLHASQSEARTTTERTG